MQLVMNWDHFLVLTACKRHMGTNNFLKPFKCMSQTFHYSQKTGKKLYTFTMKNDWKAKFVELPIANGLGVSTNVVKSIVLSRDTEMVNERWYSK